MATWPPYVDDDGTGTSGTVADKAFFDAIKAYADGLVGVPTGAISIPFNAGNFTASDGGQWILGAADIVTNRYLVIGGLVVYWFTCQNSSVVTVTPNYLFINNLPFTPRTGGRNRLSLVRENGANRDGFVEPYAGPAVYLAKLPLVVWDGSVDATDISFTALFAV